MIPAPVGKTDQNRGMQEDKRTSGKFGPADNSGWRPPSYA